MGESSPIKTNFSHKDLLNYRHRHLYALTALTQPPSAAIPVEPRLADASRRSLMCEGGQNLSPGGVVGGKGTGVGGTEWVRVARYPVITASLDTL